MVRTISATEAKVNFGAVTQRVIDDGEPVVVKNHGQPRVAIVPVEKLDRLAELEDQERRRVALERIRKLQERIAACNQDLTEEEADAIADELTRTAMDSLIAKGTLRFEE
jgi:prevent-host-death family protein